MPLDRIDLELLTALQNNARLTTTELAAEVNLAPSTCLERVRTLIREGILTGFHADLDKSALGIGLEALIAVRLSQHSRANFQSLYAHIRALPEVLTVYHLSGTKDLQIHIAVRGVQHLRDVVVEKIAAQPEVGECETSVIFEMHRSNQLPCYIEPEPRRGR